MLSNNNPFFSIIIPTYNRGERLKDTIQSALNQRYKDYEIIIVDDGGTDETHQIVQSFSSNKIHYFWKENGERGAARNFGILKSSGNYITFLDSDDIIFSNHLSEAFDFIKKNLSLPLFIQPFEIWNEKKTSKVRQKTNSSKLVNLELVIGNPMACLGVFIRREIAISNLFIEDYRFAGTEDYELWIRLANQFNIPENQIITARLMDHESRSVRNQKNFGKLVWRINHLIYRAARETDKLNNWPRGSWSKFLAHRYSYIALHGALEGFKKEAVKYYLKAISTHFSFIFSRRSFAIIKVLLLK